MLVPFCNGQPIEFHHDKDLHTSTLNIIYYKYNDSSLKGALNSRCLKSIKLLFITTPDIAIMGIEKKPSNQNQFFFFQVLPNSNDGDLTISSGWLCFSCNSSSISSKSSLSRSAPDSRAARAMKQGGSSPIAVPAPQKQRNF